MPFTKINLKWIKDLNVIPETIKLLGDSIGEKLLDSGLCNAYLNMTPEAQAAKAKVNTWDYNKIKSICTTKETTNQIKRQPMS